MSADDARRWDRRYAGQPIADPAPPDALADARLVELVNGPGRALDIACGAGAQSAWLAQRGYDVTALDASEVAVDLTHAAARGAGVGERVEALAVDLDAGLPDHLGEFDVIICQRFRSTDLYDPIVSRLRASGLAIVTVLSETGASSPGPFHAPPGELLAAFTRPDAEILHHAEAAGQESIVVRRS